MTDINEIDVAKLDLYDGDILVVQIADHLDPKYVHELFEHAMRKAGVRAPILIGRKGELDMSVIRAQALPRQEVLTFNKP